MNLQKAILTGLMLALLGACGGGGSSTPGSVSGSVDSRNVRPTGSPVVPGDVIVKFKSNVSLQSVETLRVGGRALSLVRSLALARVQLYNAGSVSQNETLRLAQSIGTRSDVEWAEPNYIRFPLAAPTDPLYDRQWHYRAMNLENAWDITTGSPNTVVAVVDTGMLWAGDSDPKTHPDLAGRVVGGYDFISDPAVANDGDGRDPDGYDVGDNAQAGAQPSYHGSHVGGTIAAATNNGIGGAGVNWKAKLLNIRVLGVGGGSTTDIVEGTLWAAGFPVAGVPNNPNPASVLNLSLGGDGPCGQFEQAAYTQIKNANKVVVVAAGNENENVNKPKTPANCQDVITVGATGPTGQRAPYSNFGPRVDVMAPGGDTGEVITVGGQDYPAGVLSTIRNVASNTFVYEFQQGTSMATPHVAGLVSLMYGLKPNLSFDQVLTILKATSRKLSAQECNGANQTTLTADDCGAGSVDAAKALVEVQKLLGQTPPAPPAPPTPPAATQAKRWVLALFQAGGDYDLNKSKALEITATGNLIPYKITGLQPGSYTVAALTDLNNNGSLDKGEPVGLRPDVAVQPGKETQNIVVTLEDLQLTSLGLSPSGSARTKLAAAVGRLTKAR